MCDSAFEEPIWPTEYGKPRRSQSAIVAARRSRNLNPNANKACGRRGGSRGVGAQPNLMYLRNLDSAAGRKVMKRRPATKHENAARTLLARARYTGPRARAAVAVLVAESSGVLWFVLVGAGGKLGLGGLRLREKRCLFVLVSNCNTFSRNLWRH